MFQRLGCSICGAGDAEQPPLLLEGLGAQRCEGLPRQIRGFGQHLGALVPSEKCVFGEENMSVICQKAARERAEPRGAMCPGERAEELQGPGTGSLGVEASSRMVAPAPGLRTLPYTLLRSPPSSSGSRGSGRILLARAEEPVEWLELPMALPFE